MRPFDLNPNHSVSEAPELAFDLEDVVITAASYEDFPILVEAMTFEDDVHQSYRPQNLQSIEGPRLYQSNSRDYQTVGQAHEAAMGIPMARLKAILLDAIPAEMLDQVMTPGDLGIRSVAACQNVHAPQGPRWAEPSLILGLGPKWDGRDRETLDLAARLAGILEQPKVAAFLPRPDGSGDSFHVQWNIAPGRRPTVQQMDEAISSLHDSYHLHLDEQGRVKALDVIGMDVPMMGLDDVVRQFDHDPLMSVETGDAYLVDRDGFKIQV